MSKRWLQITTRVVIFLAMILIIAQLYPHKSVSFTYRFEEGKPWAYGLMTASYDFPVYKTPEEYSAELQEVIQQFAPYYNVDVEQTSRNKSAIMKAAQDVLSPEELSFLSHKMDKIYQKGLLNVDEINALQAKGYENITIMRNHHAHQQPLTECFTPRMAYDTLLLKSPLGEMTMLNRLGLNRLLLPNLTFDSITTAKMYEKAIGSVTESIGMVQAGEKIIDRGEIVDAGTYRILESLRRTMTEQGIDYRRAAWSMAGTVTLIVLFVVLMTLYLIVFRPHLFDDLRTLFFFAILTTGIIVAACLVERFTPLSIYIVPFAWVPIITRVFFDSRTALYLHMVTVLICAFVAPQPFEFLVLQMAAGMVAVSSLKDMAQRSQLVQTAAWVVLAYSLGYTAFILAAKGSPEMLHWHTYLYFLANGLLVVFAYGLIYLFERVFRLVSSITLVELTNINSDLMLEFAEKAPGSFQHSLQVSNLAMEAAKKVGANALLVRAGGLYHDIGKIAHPENYTENQQDGPNPLLLLSSEEAAQAVISHVQDGLRLAEKHRLPEVVTQFIRSHHGTSKTRFFYNTYINQHPGEPVNEALFSYPGPRPASKEAAILMMADAVEARSRSLKEYTPDSIRDMVDQMVALQLADAQFEEAPLTFKDMQEIKAVFVRKLISMHHHRIAYPELKK